MPTPRRSPDRHSRRRADNEPAGHSRMNGVAASSFAHLATSAASLAGRPLTFLVAVLLLLVWAVLGPMFHYADAWQLAVNTVTTIVTFLMVFLIQNTQNRDTVALHIKLDELIRVTRGARNAMMALEDLDEEQLLRLRQELEHDGGRESRGD